VFATLSDALALDGDGTVWSRRIPPPRALDPDPRLNWMDG
jgi:hypothetical protein